MKLQFSVLFIFIVSSNILNASYCDAIIAAESIHNQSGVFMTSLKIIFDAIPLILVGVVSFFAGRSLEFRKEKQKAYSESIQPILAAHFGSKKLTEEELNQCNLKILLYGNRKVAIKLQEATRIFVDPSRGDITDAFQKLLATMRNDVQLLKWFPCQRLTPEEFTHIYFKYNSKKFDNNT